MHVALNLSVFFEFFTSPLAARPVFGSPLAPGPVFATPLQALPPCSPNSLFGFAPPLILAAVALASLLYGIKVASSWCKWMCSFLVTRTLKPFKDHFLLMMWCSGTTWWSSPSIFLEAARLSYLITRAMYS